MKTFMKQLEIILTIACLIMIGLLVYKLKSPPSEELPAIPAHHAAAAASLNSRSLEPLAREEANRILQSGDTDSLVHKMQQEDIAE
ncbi:MAG: hypothetical protein EOM26_11485 [Alphaproteobacteria bacterium]|nr:hypothetical protein [Alphaproteobacteria bacterium]